MCGATSTFLLLSALSFFFSLFSPFHPLLSPLLSPSLSVFVSFPSCRLLFYPPCSLSSLSSPLFQFSLLSSLSSLLSPLLLPLFSPISLSSPPCLLSSPLLPLVFPGSLSSLLSRFFLLSSRFFLLSFLSPLLVWRPDDRNYWGWGEVAVVYIYISISSSSKMKLSVSCGQLISECPFLLPPVPSSGGSPGGWPDEHQQGVVFILAMSN